MKTISTKFARLFVLAVCFGSATMSASVQADNVAQNFVTFDKSIITPKEWPNVESNPFRSVVNTPTGGVLGGQVNTIPFSTAEGGKLFSGTGHPQTDMYGGVQFNYSATSGVVTEALLLGDPTSYFKAFKAGSLGEVNAPTSIDLLIMWRKDQFTDSPATALKFDGTTDSKFSFLLTQSGGQWDLPMQTRFVIKNGSQYYISEAPTTTTVSAGIVADPEKTYELIELASFNNSSTEGLRWGVFNPTANDFFIPTVLPTFSAVDFNDVQEVGVIMHAYKEEYGNDIEFSNFTVNGIKTDLGTSISTLSTNATKVYNNNGQIAVDLTALKGASTVSVIDTKGSVIKTIQNVGAEMLTIHVANKGIYLVQVNNAGKTSTLKVVL